MQTTKWLSVALFLFVGCQAPGSASSWRQELERRLPVLGHRNFIVVADSAYPWQSNPGIETIYTGSSQLAVLGEVLGMIDAAPHVQPNIYLDAELGQVPEQHAAGIGAYRTELAAMLGDLPVQRLAHLEIIGKLDEAASLFRVVVLKTDMVLPYTSVFIELDCGYWNGEQEQQLRAALAR